ncbi:uncharacterized protein LOC135105646 [Scylla paramamosain]|uniref:uncharacterized protein LOC135105646 n=1 Tax=Scylla paramamosain TaxID=85552 RepID=UPI0030830862
MRDAVTPGERLTLALRYIASGETVIVGLPVPDQLCLDITDHPRSFPCYQPCVGAQVVKNHAPSPHALRSTQHQLIAAWPQRVVLSHVVTHRIHFACATVHV